MIDEFENDEKFVKIYSYTNSNFLIKSEISFDGTELSQDSNV